MSFLRTLGEALIFMSVGMLVSLFTTLPTWFVMGIAVLVGIVYLDWRGTREVSNIVHHIAAAVITGLLVMVGTNLPMPLWLLSLIAILIAIVAADFIAPYLPGYSPPRQSAAVR